MQACMLSQPGSPTGRRIRSIGAISGRSAASSASLVTTPSRGRRDASLLSRAETMDESDVGPPHAQGGRCSGHGRLMFKKRCRAATVSNV